MTGAQGSNCRHPDGNNAHPQTVQLTSSSSPAALAAARILGSTLASSPAILKLVRKAPMTSETAMNVVKECVMEDPMASERLEVLTRMLKARWAQQQRLMPDGIPHRRQPFDLLGLTETSLSPRQVEPEQTVAQDDLVPSLSRGAGTFIISKPACFEGSGDHEFSNITNASLGSVGNALRQPSRTGALHHIAYKEGEITIFPATLMQSIQDFLGVNPGLHLSCAQRDWRPDTNLQRTRNGDVRRWITYPQGEPLQMGRFRYGTDHKILVARASQGSDWQNGEPKIVVYGGHGNNDFKIWSGQRVLDTIPNEFGVVRWAKVEEDSDEGDKQDDTDATHESRSAFRALQSNLGVYWSGTLQETPPVTTGISDSSTTSGKQRRRSFFHPRLAPQAVAAARKARSLSPAKITKRRRGGVVVVVVVVVVKASVQPGKSKARG